MGWIDQYGSLTKSVTIQVNKGICLQNKPCEQTEELQSLHYLPVNMHIFLWKVIKAKRSQGHFA